MSGTRCKQQNVINTQLIKCLDDRCKFSKFKGPLANSN